MASKNIRPYRHLYVPTTKKFGVSFLRTWTQLIAGAGACAIFSKLYGENIKLPTMVICFQMALRYNDGASSLNVAR